MSFQIVCKRVAAATFAAFTVFTATAIAQKPTVIVPTNKTMRVAERNNLYCAGFVQTTPIDTRHRIVAGLEEVDKFHFSGHDVIYLNAGPESGVKVGDMLSVVRPRGRVETRWTQKDGGLGYYVQEVGAIEVIRVKRDVAIAKVKVACDNFLLGDLLTPVEPRVAPEYRQRDAMDLFADPSGKAMGRLFMARGNGELIASEFVVYIDLGAEDNVKTGDYLTIFRWLGEGNPVLGHWGESVSARDEGFQSDTYRGGKFSNQAGSKSGGTAQGRVITTGGAKEGRPEDLRKVVGEMVILNVKERTATALVTRNVGEIHPGDWVEVQ